MPTSGGKRVDAARDVAGALESILSGQEPFVREAFATLDRPALEEAAVLGLRLLASALTWTSETEQARILDGIRSLGRPDTGWGDYNAGPG
jgi:hypothetical protein